MTQGLTILGATGSIGRSTLEVVALHPDRYHVFALTAHRNLALLKAQCERFRPRYAVVADGDLAPGLAAELAPLGVALLTGVEGLSAVAADPGAPLVMAAIVGAAGLLPALAAVAAGKRLLLANKEVLVMSGDLFMARARASGAEILPIDSEHNAIFQCLPDRPGGLAELGVRRILLTASGGPFRQWTREQLDMVTPEQACAHPNWEMGQKISVDSASMMNKGLEVIEACRLFDVSPDQVEVVVHPQSIIHSMVEYEDSSVLAQLGNPDMRTPIAHAMAWPDRMASGVSALDLVQLARLDFEAPDLNRFPCLGLAFEAIRRGGSSPLVLNAANEVAVAAFLARKLAFMGIPDLISRAMEHFAAASAQTLEEMLALDTEVRDFARADLMS